MTTWQSTAMILMKRKTNEEVFTILNLLEKKDMCVAQQPLSMAALSIASELSTTSLPVCLSSSQAAPCRCLTSLLLNQPLV